jgi:hypothetical protein
MITKFTYDYIDIMEFGLNKCPFTLNVLITNFIDNRFLEICYTAEKNSNLPNNMNEFLYTKLGNTDFREFIEYINTLNSHSYLHFEVNLNNSIELIHKQYITCKISEITPI